MAIITKFDVGILSADGETSWAQEDFDSTREAFAYGLEWAARRLRDKASNPVKIRVCLTRTDDDYDNVIEVDEDHTGLLLMEVA